MGDSCSGRRVAGGVGTGTGGWRGATGAAREGRAGGLSVWAAGPAGAGMFGVAEVRVVGLSDAGAAGGGGGGGSAAATWHRMSSGDAVIGGTRRADGGGKKN